MEFKAGSIIQFSRGSYSDYECIGLYVVIEDIENLKDFKQFVLDNWETYSRGIYDRDIDSDYDTSYVISSSIGAELIRRGKVLPLVLNEIYLGDYGKLGDLE